MLVPATTVGSILSSCSARITPMCANPLRPPPPSTSAIFIAPRFGLAGVARFSLLGVARAMLRSGASEYNVLTTSHPTRRIDDSFHRSTLRRARYHLCNERRRPDKKPNGADNTPGDR